MAKKLTAVSVANARPGPQRREISDGGTGLYLVLQPNGKRSWAVRYRRPAPDKRNAKLTLDGALTLAAARKAAADALHELTQGVDPAAKKFAARADAEKATAERAGDTIENLAKQFIERHANKKRPSSRQQITHVLNDIVVPAWRSRLVHDIKRRDVIDLVESIAETRPIMANRVLAWLNAFFNWCVQRDVLAASPCAGVKRPSEENVRNRTLSDDEIKALWHACDDIGGPEGACVKMLLLTGQRKTEVAGMRRRSEIVGDMWTLAPSRTKNKKPHAVPLSTQALALVDAMPRFAGGDYVFTTTGKAPLGHFDRIKRAIDARMKPTTSYVLHDLRRTTATGLQKLGVPLEVTEAVLGHRGGSRAGIMSVYQTHQYESEKRHALQAWADRVERLVTGAPAAAVADIAVARKARAAR